jgi:predicted lysophospholipase L1 biosynthesis ABC-type transport system permease subunit
MSAWKISFSVTALYYKVLLSMNRNTSPQETLAEIRQLMERSSRFISLSGLSGVFAGVYALVGAYVAYSYLNLTDWGYFAGEALINSRTSVITFIVFDALAILVLAIGTGIFLTTRKAKKDGNSIFDATAKKLIVNLCIPLITGGLFCLALIYNGSLIYVPAAMLIFYGMALVQASHFTRHDIRNLGFLEIVLGLLASFIIGFGFVFWCVGFGVLHILYGTYMYFKYEK